MKIKNLFLMDVKKHILIINHINNLIYNCSDSKLLDKLKTLDLENKNQRFLFFVETIENNLSESENTL